MNDLSSKESLEYNFKTTNKSQIASSNYSSLQLLKTLASLEFKRRELVKLYNSDDETVDFHYLDSDKFYQNNELEYLIMRGKRFNGVLSPFSSKVNLEIRDILLKKLHEHVEKLSKLFPFYNFSYLNDKIDKAVFKIRQVQGKLISPVAGACSTSFPIISLNLDNRNNLPSNGDAVMKHEFTHFCCKNESDKKTFLNTIPTFLNEGITQIITLRLLENEIIDEETKKTIQNIYILNMELANILIAFLGEETVISSYFDQNFTLIKDSLISLNRKYSGRFSIDVADRTNTVIDDKFISRLNYELWIIQSCLYKNPKFKNDYPTNISRFPYLNSLLTYFDSIIDVLPKRDASTHVNYKNLILDFKLKLNYVLEEFSLKYNQIQRN